MQGLGQEARAEDKTKILSVMIQASASLISRSRLAISSIDGRCQVSDSKHLRFIVLGLRCCCEVNTVVVGVEGGNGGKGGGAQEWQRWS